MAQSGSASQLQPQLGSPSAAANKRKNCRVQNFYDSFTGRTHNLRLPVAIHPRTLGGGVRPWIGGHSGKILLLNPLGKDRNMITTLSPLFLPMSCTKSITVGVSGSPSQGSFMALLHEKAPLKRMARVRVGPAPSNSCDMWTMIHDGNDHNVRQVAPFRGHFYGIDIKRGGC